MHKGAISRRGFLACAVGALAVAGAVSHGQENEKRPNVILIMADDLGYGDLGCYGSTMERTPHIDALAARGLRFTDFHSNGPVCSPTRASLLTGSYSQRWGIEFVFRPQEPENPGLPPSAPAWPRLFREKGYQTALVGKWHLGYTAESHPLAFGFDTFRGFLSGNVDYQSHVNNAGGHDWWHDREEVHEEGYTTSLITKHSVDFIEAQGNEPYCLVVTHAAPHDPFQGPGDPAYRKQGVPPKGKGPREDHGAARREMVAALDGSVGAIVDAVERSGHGENTFIFFCSDNGAPTPGSNGGLRGWKGSVWEGGHRVPAIAVWPGRIAPGETAAMALTMDLFPTLTGFIGAEVPAGAAIDGVSLEGVLLRGESLAERNVYWRTHPDRGERAVRRGPWKLVKTEDGGGLYHLGDDPGETRDRSTGQERLVSELAQALASWEERYVQTQRLA